VTASYAAITTLLVSLAILASALFVSRSRLPAEASSAATSTIYRIRSVYFIFILVVAVALLALTLPMTPYPRKSGE
jgi:hypothetical protein